MTLLTLFHSQKVVKVIEIPGTSQIASIDHSGLLLIW